jgi:hypothetical protein
MQQWLTENGMTLFILTAFFICEILAHTSKVKANSLFQLIFGWIKKQKEQLNPTGQLTQEEKAEKSE